MPRCPTCYRRLPGGVTCPSDGAAAPAPGAASEHDAGQPPDVPGYAVTAYLGSGGSAVVWAGQRLADGKAVALKIARDTSELIEQRLAREAEALILIGPPHVPEHYETGRTAVSTAAYTAAYTDQGRVYVAMERLRGRTLASTLESMPALPDLTWARRVSEGLLTTLEAVHRKGVIHRDLKPENIFLEPDAPLAVRIVDFGLTRALGPAAIDLTRHGTVMGTAEYMAPEQLHDSSATDMRTDIYSLGIILYELVALRPPFVGDRASIEHGHTAMRPPRLQKLAPLPEAVESVIMGCLAKNPDRRPPDVATLRGQLARAWTEATPRPAAPVGESKTSLLVEKRQPVILAWVDAKASPAELAATIKQYGGFVARQRGTHHVCVFAGTMVDDPLEAALSCVHELAEIMSVRAALHLARLAIRRKRRGPPVVIGQAVDRPETWLPDQDFSGIVLTSQLAETRPEGTTRPSIRHPGFFVLVDEPMPQQARTTLVGREPILARAAASLTACLATATPGLFTIVGETGLGKTRLAHELADLAAVLCPEARVVSVQAMRTGIHRSDNAAEALRHELRGLGLGLGAQPGASARTRSSPGQPVVIILDNAHWVDGETLDWVEYATLDHANMPLWLVVIAHSHLESMRSQWGSRANRHDRAALLPLDLDAAMALTAELLLPAEYPPAEFLRRLAQWSGGNPQLLTGLVAELKRRGVVQKRVHGDGWDVATAELEELPAAPAEQWLAARLLDDMPPELAAYVRVCSVLGATFSADELAQVQDALEEHGAAGSPVDAEVGIDLLAAQGIVERAGPGHVAFTSPALQDAVYKLLADEDRREIHRHAARYWEAELQARAHLDELAVVGATGSMRHEAALERFARHAGASGRPGEAADTFVRLGDTALLAHNYVEADSRYTTAIRMGGQNVSLLARAHAGRGRARYYIYRNQEAFEDLGIAREMHRALDDMAVVVELWLEEAKVADAVADWGRSARCAEQAQSELDALGSDERRHLLATRCLMAMGRSRWREGRARQAIELLSEAARQAKAMSDYETEVIAGLLLGCALVHEGSAQQAEHVFDEVIARCTQAQDRLYECRVYANRMYLWRKQPSRAIEDLRRSIQLAREVGNPEPERVATHNLAELLYWNGNYDEALILARRGRVLQQRFWKQMPQDTLLLGRIHAVRGELGETEEMMNWLARECDPDTFDPSVDILYRTVRLVLQEIRHQPSEALSSSRWDELMASARTSLPSEECIEVLWWHAHAAIHLCKWQQARHALMEASSRLEEAPIWLQRVRALERALP